MNKRIGLVVAGLGAAALMAGGTAYAASSASSAATTNSSTTIYGCYDNGGNLKVALPLGTTACPKGYSAISWNEQGQAGANGNTILNGSGAPTSAVGNNGDFYIDTSADVLYGPKANGSWPATGTSLVGPQGVAGTGATVSQAPGADCPNGGVEVQDGNSPPDTAYACNGTNGTNGSNAAPEHTWTVVCTPNPPGTPGSGDPAGGCAFLRSTTSVPAGTVVTPVGLTVSGGCSAADGTVASGIAAGTPLTEFNGVQIDDFSSDLFASDFAWGSTDASENLSGPITIPSASQLVVTVNDDCTTPVTVTFTFDLTQPFS